MPRHGGTKRANRKHNRGHKMHSTHSQRGKANARNRTSWQQTWFTHRELLRRYEDIPTKNARKA